MLMATLDCSQVYPPPSHLQLYLTSVKGILLKYKYVIVFIEFSPGDPTLPSSKTISLKQNVLYNYVNVFIELFPGVPTPSE